MKLQTKENRIRLIWGISLLLLWGCAIALFVHANGKLTVQELLQYQPKSKPMAALAMCGLFLLKSVDFLIYSGLLYSISGIIFPFPGAVAVNIVGMFIISIYLISVEYIDDSIRKTLEDVSDREADFGVLLPDSEQVREKVQTRLQEKHEEIQSHIQEKHEEIHAHYKELRREKAPESEDEK